MKPARHFNPSEETGTRCPVTSKYGSDLQTSMEVWIHNNRTQSPLSLRPQYPLTNTLPI